MKRGKTSVIYFFKKRIVPYGLSVVLVAAGLPSSCSFPTHLLHLITPMQCNREKALVTQQ